MRFFQEKLIKATAEVLNKRVRLKQTATVNIIKDFTRTHLENTATYQELVDGELKYHFGFPKGTEKERVDSIIDVLVVNIYHKFDGWKPNGKNMAGNWRLHLAKAAYAEILNLDGSTVENTGRFGGTIPWLDWLLNSGDDPIISDFHIKMGSYESKVYSRSGGAIMVPKYTWGVPSEYSGTQNDNWLTRSFTDRKYQKQIHETIKVMFK